MNKSQHQGSRPLLAISKNAASKNFAFRKHSSSFILSEPMHYTYRSCLAVETHVMKLCSHSASRELATFTAHGALQFSAVVL